MRSELKLLEKFIQHCHAKQEGQSDTYITQIYSNMQELLLVQFLNQELQHQQTKVDELQKNINLLKEALDIKEQLNQKLREREDELQKRVDAVNLVLEGLKNANYMHSGNKAYNSLLIEKLEQALNGGESCQ